MKKLIVLAGVLTLSACAWAMKMNESEEGVTFDYHPGYHDWDYIKNKAKDHCAQYGKAVTGPHSDRASGGGGHYIRFDCVDKETDS